jgi:hypothetical protein
MVVWRGRLMQGNLGRCRSDDHAVSSSCPVSTHSTNISQSLAHATTEVAPVPALSTASSSPPPYQEPTAYLNHARLHQRLNILGEKAELPCGIACRDGYEWVERDRSSALWREVCMGDDNGDRDTDCTQGLCVGLVSGK